MNMSNLWEAWPIAGPWQLSPFSSGTNNIVWRAETADKQYYVVRLISDLSRIPLIYYEAALLEALASRQPSFSLPIPLKARNGDIVVLFEQESGSQACAILTHLLPGSILDRNDLSLATQGGSTLAWLDYSLATLPEILISRGNQLQQTYGQLACSHPLVPNPLVAVERLPIERESMQRMQKLLSTVRETVDDLYYSLPQQLIHSDYGPGNILVQENHISAILDFEFAGVDLRVLEICVALSWWPVNVLGTGKEWDIIDAFGNAYIEHFPLDEQELLAFPAIWRLRGATSFVHRMGRYIAGLETDARIRDRVRHSLWREAWLSANQETLVQHALAWR